MSVLSDLRTQVVDAFKAADLRAFPTVPSKFAAPAVFVGPGDPYVTREGAMFNGEVVHLSVNLVAAAGTNPKQADELDDLILQALDVLYSLEEAGYGVGVVDRPGEVTVNLQAHLGVSIDIATEIRR